MGGGGGGGIVWGKLHTITVLVLLDYCGLIL